MQGESGFGTKLKWRKLLAHCTTKFKHNIPMWQVILGEDGVYNLTNKLTFLCIRQIQEPCLATWSGPPPASRWYPDHNELIPLLVAIVLCSSQEQQDCTEQICPSLFLMLESAIIVLYWQCKYSLWDSWFHWKIRKVSVKSNCPNRSCLIKRKFW